MLAPWEEYFMDEIKDLPVLKTKPPELDPEARICPGGLLMAF